MRRWMFALSALVGTGGLIAACGVGTDCDFGLCAGPPVVGPEGGDGDVVQPPAGCDPKADPKDAPACVVNEYGVFVSPTGKPDAPGTKEAPLDSITSAIAKRGGKPRIYVCEGTYAGKVDLSVAVSVFGGFACGSWTYSGTKTLVEATAAGEHALRVRGVSEITIADLHFTAKAGDKTSRSSIAAFVSDSRDVVLRRLTLAASEGANGDNGTPGVTGTPTPADLNGNNPLDAASGGDGGAAKTCTCSSGGSTTGGRGGDTLGLTINGEAGQSAMAVPDPPTATGAGQTGGDCANGVNFARPGSKAPPGADAKTPTGIGDLSVEGWKPADGVSGENGKPGQGGGGAGGNSGGASPGGGGGGACGGCGGTGGSGGTGGGSSIALLALNSPLKLEGSVLTAAKAGRGGDGAPGGSGLTGGAGGARVGSCQGAAGGDGGHGGAGAGGAGGVSAGIVHKGGAPLSDGATEDATTFGAPGAKGTGGIPQTNDGLPGEAKKVLAL